MGESKKNKDKERERERERERPGGHGFNPYIPHWLAIELRDMYEVIER